MGLCYSILFYFIMFVFIAYIEENDDLDFVNVSGFPLLVVFHIVTVIVFR